MALINYDDYTKEAKKYYDPQRNQALVDKGALFDQQNTTVNDNYDFQIAEAEKSYSDSHRENAVQKLINERQIAENMANMGLTNSGLNRTQQTAVQLSYANNKAALDQQKQSQIGALERDRASALTDIAASRQSALDSVNQYYDKLELERANSKYTTDVEAETERLKNYYTYLQQQDEANKKASYIIKADDALLSSDYTGKLSDNGVSVYKNSEGKFVYKDSNSDKKVVLDAGISPYTGKMNDDLLDEHGEYDPSRAFDNGYQPRYFGDTKLKAAKWTSDGSTATYPFHGNPQTIWKANGKLYHWERDENRYIEFTEEETKLIRSQGII